jgi:hypothetical protein
VKIKSWAILQRIIELFTQKLSLNSQKYGFRIQDSEKTHSGSRGQKGTGTRIRIRKSESRHKKLRQRKGKKKKDAPLPAGWRS